MIITQKSGTTEGAIQLGAPVFLLYLAWTLHSRVLPNWIAPSVVPLFCVMIIYWAEAGKRFVRGWLAGGLAFGFVAVVLLHNTDLIEKIAGRPLPEKIDPLQN